jgi:hypothetical protein
MAMAMEGARAMGSATTTVAMDDATMLAMEGMAATRQQRW